jgi:hypothetical protein
MRGRVVALLLAMAAAGAGQARAQEPPDSAAAQPQDTAAQQQADSVAVIEVPPLMGPRFSLALMLGPAGFGEIQSQTIITVETDLAGAVLDSAEASRSLVADGGLQAAVSLAYAVTPAWVLRVGAGVTRGTLRTEYEGDPDEFVRPVGPLSLNLLDPIAGSRATDFTVLEVESALRYRIPSSRRLQPYLELGTVMSRWTAKDAVAGAAGLEDGITRFGVIGAVGGRLPLRERLSLRLRVSTRALGNPAAGGGPESLAIPGSRLVPESLEPGGAPFADTTREVLRALRLEAGLSLDLGRAADPPPDRSGADASTSPTPR